MRVLKLRKITKYFVCCCVVGLAISTIHVEIGSKDLVENYSVSREIDENNELEDVDIIVKAPHIDGGDIEKLEGIEKIEKKDEWIKVDANGDVRDEDLIERLEDMDDVEYAEENVTFEITETVPDDPNYSSQWALPKIDAPDAWDSQQGTGNIVVAVLDTGVDWDHVDINSNIWTNTGEIAGNEIDDDMNGYVDDIRGWDFSNNDNNPDDDNNHGTHVAGIIGAETDNATGVSGTIWNVKIMALKCFYSSGTGSLDDAIDALDYALDNGADIINMSWRGTSYAQSLQDKINELHSNGIIQIVASGNDYRNTENYYPASMNNVLTVGATVSSDARAAFSNYGYKVEIAAPGDDILSLGRNDTYRTSGGTSMATPYAAGVAALVLDENNALDNEQVMQVLMENSDSFSPDQYSGRGRVNANNAVSNASITNGVVSQIKSDVEVDLDTATVGDTINITVTIKDGNDNVLSGKTVYVQSSRGGVDTIAPSSDTTDVLGEVDFTLDSTTSGSLYLTAFEDNGTPADTSDDLVIAFMPNVEYEAGPHTKFGFNSLSGKKTQNSFSITIYAQDQYGNTVTSFGNNVSLSDLSGNLNVSQSGNFSAGSWTGSVRIDSYKLSNKITATYTDKTGQSNTFNVTHPNALVISVSPNYSYNSGSRYSQSVTVSGVNFRDGIDVKLTKSGHNDISCSNVSVSTSSSLTCSINTDGEGTNYWSLYVQNYGIDTNSNTGANFYNVYKRSDLNRDWSVDIFDFSQLLGEWSWSGSHISDINGDSSVNVYDFSFMLGEWVSSY